MADTLGDPTPRSQGRVSLNPLAHLDPLGTIMLLLAGFGWGKPVQFDPYNLKNQQRDTVLIALAGPVSNILLAFVIALLLPWLPIATSIWMVIISINISLAVFNLLPIHPLDGSKILAGLLPVQYAREYNEVMQQYGFIILLALIFLPINGGAPVDYLIRPVMNGLLMGIFTFTTFIQSLVGF
jgi:Zn-dependent protease